MHMHTNIHVCTHAHTNTVRFIEYRELTSRVLAGDADYLEQRLKAHVSKQNRMASLKSR